MLINLRNALMAGKRTPTAKDYVQSGLVAMWDGIENAGWGTHNASATKWKDLVGNYDFNLNYSTTIYSNHIYCDGRQSAGDTGALIDVPAVTIEIVAQYLSSSVNTAIFMTGGNNSSYYTEVFAISASNTSFIFSYHNVDWKDTVVHSWSKNLGNTDCYKDGVNIGTKGNATLDVSSARGYIGRIGGTGNVGCQCRIYSIRLYSRALTAEEIAANYAIDKARFGLS